MIRVHAKALTLTIALVVASTIMGGCGLSRPPAQLSQQPSSPPASQPTTPPPATGQNPSGQTPTTGTAAADTKQAVLDRAKTVIQALKTQDTKSLADVVHPDFGLRFSPYGNIRTGKDGDLVFTASEIGGLFADKTVRTWGAYDGSGNPIDLTFAGYYQKFVYDVDFATAPNIGYNEVLGQGNTLVNTTEVYPDAAFVEFHFDGFDPKYGGADWRSLRLVFENKDGVWYLVGIVHDQWTI